MYAIHEKYTGKKIFVSCSLLDWLKNDRRCELLRKSFKNTFFSQNLRPLSPAPGNNCPPAPTLRHWAGVSGTKSLWSWQYFFISETYLLTKLSHEYGKFRLHGERESRSAPANNGGIGDIPTFQILLQSALADKHCMLAGEGRISSNMIIRILRSAKLALLR